MIYSTPSKDFDGVTAGLRLLETAVDLIALGDDQPEKKPEYLQEAANLIKDAWLAVQTAAGRAIETESAQKERAGLRECLICRKWQPVALLVRELAGYGSEEQGKVNHWFRCVACRDAHQSSPEPDRDPFESEDEPGHR